MRDDGTTIERVEEVVRDAMRASAHARIWKDPIVASVSVEAIAEARLFDVCPAFTATPEGVLAGGRSVIAVFLPFVDSVAASNVGETEPSREWCEAYVATNSMIGTVGDALAAFLAERGYSLAKIPATHNFDRRTLLSAWSHRHVATLAGIGTFGSNNMLITERGCCGRLGSYVTDFEFDQSGRRIDGEYCLERRGKPCGACRKRCPAGAYRADGFDRFACYAVCLKNENRFPGIGKADVCGKCLVGLPCSTRRP